MTSMSDQELAQTEVLLRQRLGRLADRAPTAVHLPDEIAVVADRRPTRRGRRAGVIAAVTALIGAGGFTTYSFIGASNDGGTTTPEEAVRTFVSAMDHEDLLGMIDVTLPEEVKALRFAVDSTTSDAKRVGLLGEAFDAGAVQGIDIAVDDLVLDTDFLEGGLAAVTATSGTISASLDPSTFLFGAKLRAVVGNGDRASTTSANLADSPRTVMTVERGGRWYVSVEYTLAEFARQSVGWEVPGPVSRTPVGFDSPEAAATGFYDRLATLDLQSAIDTFAPGEDAMAWLAQSWMADAQASMERARADGWSVAISGLTYDALGDGSQLTLRPATFVARGTAPASYGQDSSGSSFNTSERTVILSFDGSGYTIVPAGEPVPATVDGLTFTPGFPEANENFNFTTSNEDGTVVQLDLPTEPTSGEPQTFKVERADDCTTVTGTLVPSMYGPDIPPSSTAVDGGYRTCGAGNEILGGLAILISGSALELPAVSVVQSGGRWYVSPMGTILASATVNLHDMVDGTSLFDSALGPYIYGGMSRGILELMLKGQSERSIDPGCLPALTVDGGVVTGVVADPPPAAIRACNRTVSFSESSSSGSATAPPVAEVTASTPPPASTP